MKKYELTEETIMINGNLKLYRIRALKDFSNANAGDLGGYVESEKNLSQEGDCWIFDEAKVYNDARVSGSASVHDSASVSGSAWVFGFARIYDNSIINGTSRLFENI